LHQGSSEWRTIDNLPSFHKHAPKDHPPGDHLLAVIRRCYVRERANELCAKLETEYMNGDLVERRYLLSPVETLVTERRAVGAARLIIQPAFEPEQIVTLVFGQGAVELEAVKGATNLWYSLRTESSEPPLGALDVTDPDFSHFIETNKRTVTVFLRAGGKLPPGSGETTFSPSAARRLSKTLKREDVLSWEELLALARLAPACRTNACDGVGYWHKLVCRDVSLCAEWSNPCPSAHPQQMLLLAKYKALLMKLGLGEYWSQSA
jgi:hypothetical protein